MWDERYSKPGYAYGTAPNDWLAESASALSSPVICLAAGQGRNAVWLAERGLEVHAVDGSKVGVERTLAYAAERGVTVHATHADLADFDLGEDRWGGVVTIFAHVPPDLRKRLHRAIARGLRPGGALVLEAYTPRQFGRGTGGPPKIEMLYEPDAVAAELAGLELRTCREVERTVVEGWAHTGLAATVQIVAVRP